MSWMAKLHDSYDHIVHSNQEGSDILWPVSHFVKYGHLEVVIDIEGNFLKGQSKILHGADSPTLIPVTESSAGRSGAKIAPHPLCDEIGYCAADYPKINKNKVNAYMKQLKKWANSSFSHPKLKAILNYLNDETLWQDLSQEFEFPLKVKKKNGKNQKIMPEKVFIRWSVIEPGNPVQGTWQDEELIKAWIAYDSANTDKEDFCYILGCNKRVTSNHPRFLRWPGDGAKIVSSNDSSGYTFRGRFTDTETSMKKFGTQALGISFDATQKAHNALRWLISRQGYRNGDQVYIAWAVSGKEIPEPLTDSWSMLSDDISLQLETEEETGNQVDHVVDLGQYFAQQFNQYLSGYRIKLEPNEQIVVMGLDSATPGRIGVIYYQELLASEFLNRIHDWHVQFAWPQRHKKKFSNCDDKKKAFKKTIWPISTPVPRIIAEAAYGNILKKNDSLKKNLMERILPCIVGGRSFPKDVMLAAVRRASNRNLKRLARQFSKPESEKAEWEKHLGVACALFKGFYMRHPDKTKRRKYAMALEEEKNTRDYLYGRLLAIAEYIEEIALSVGGESRPTSAARMMQRFADRPFSTWRNIELGLQPYMQRLQANRPGFLTNRKKELDTVLSSFDPNGYTSEKPLSGEFLLGYHCQKQYWRDNKPENIKNQSNKEANYEHGE